VAGQSAKSQPDHEIRPAAGHSTEVNTTTTKRASSQSNGFISSSAG